MLSQKIALSILFLLFSFCAQAQVHVTYEKPKNNIEAEVRDLLKSTEAVELVEDFINTHFALPQSIEFVIGGEDGPLYDAQASKIIIPYLFIGETKQRFLAANYDDATVDNATIDAFIHTLFHEFAHAIIPLYNIPVLAKEEDAADAFATVLLIEYFEQGQEIAISAADLFRLESHDIVHFETSDFSGEHSLDIQRYYSTLCKVYGSAPKQYAHLIKDNAFSPERAELCIEDYEYISQSWLNVLEPYIKK